MTRGFSLYLDGLRFCAALIVLMSHLAYPRFTEGRWIWIRELNLGSDAVVVFFVLSGLVISHSVERKAGQPGQYAFDRLSRLVSVALPALLVGFALDRIGAALAPGLYSGWQYNPLPLWETVVRGLTFSNEWTGFETRLGTNGPYWSLSYEAAYYALFGVAVYTRGVKRWALLAAGAIVVGLNVLLLMPCWLFGVVLQKYISQGRLPSRKTAYALALAPVAFYAAALAVDLPTAISQLYPALEWRLRFSDEFVWNTLLALLVMAHLTGIAALCKERSGRFERPVRWLAGGSFSLYLVHYPALQFFAALGIAGSTVVWDLALLSVVCVFCYGFASLFERPLGRWREAMRTFAILPLRLFSPR
ncbi:MAG: acyltransferase [Pseudomonadota bacterium]